jgi:Major Facilitator Superfamily
MKRKFECVRRRNLLGRVNGSFVRRNEPPQAADNSRGEAFRRDTPTLLCYAVLAAFAFWRYAFGLAPALLRAEMHFSYTLVGAYSAVWGFGTVLVGVSFAAMARRLPRAVLLWGSAAGATAGAGLFAATHTIALTLLGAAVLGFAGTILLTCTQVILSDRHGERRDRALTEANIGASRLRGARAAPSRPAPGNLRRLACGDGSAHLCPSRPLPALAAPAAFGSP